MRNMFRSTKNKDGFTLIEVLLSVSLIAVMAGISIPFYQTFQNRNNLDVASNTIAQTARRAQLLAQANDSDSVWSIYIEPGYLTLFKGDTTSTRDTEYDERFEISSGITATGDLMIVFDKVTGKPDNAKTIILTSTTNETRTISINTKGIIEY